MGNNLFIHLQTPSLGEEQAAKLIMSEAVFCCAKIIHKTLTVTLLELTQLGAVRGTRAKWSELYMTYSE